MTTKPMHTPKEIEEAKKEARDLYDYWMRDGISPSVIFDFLIDRDAAYRSAAAEREELQDLCSWLRLRIDSSIRMLNTEQEVSEKACLHAEKAESRLAEVEAERDHFKNEKSVLTKTVLGYIEELGKERHHSKEGWSRLARASEIIKKKDEALLASRRALFINSREESSTVIPIVERAISLRIEDKP